ncbi:MAG: FliM/FliN family flagellar motor switch protein [Pirellulaceae bacterium]
MIAKNQRFRQRVLQIETEVSVVLATKRIALQEVLNLTPGTMIHFDKGCDEPLMLQAGHEPIARGDAVKVGDKFGIRVRDVNDGDSPLDL